MAAGKGVFDNLSDEGLENVLGEADAAGTATTAKTAPDHLRVTTQATNSARVISVDQCHLPNSGSQ